MNITNALKKLNDGEPLRLTQIESRFALWHIGEDRVNGLLASQLLRQRWVSYSHRPDEAIRVFVITPAGKCALARRINERTRKVNESRWRKQQAQQLAA